MRDMHHPVSIKTSPPALGGVIERERLIKALTDLPAAAKWLQSPSGTGKSTLAASYARSRNKLLVWYRLDERDNDPAFFYDEFERALRARGIAAPLPKFCGDDHDRQQQFAQRFTDALTPQLAERPTLIVMDDAQQVTSAEMQLALAALVTVAVSQSEILCVSQSTVPTAFFDAVAARQLVLLNDADLHFDADECKAMTAALRVGAVESESIAALTGGHAGALVLACELLRGTDPKSALGSTTVERIHSHLLSKLVERMPEPRRHLLLQTAFVAQVTRPIAVELAGPDAARELDGLVESGLLRRVGDGTGEVFEAHGLVRQGMQALVRAQHGAAVARSLAERTANVLADSDQREAAFAILADMQSTVRAIEQLTYLADRYASEGQVDLLLASIARLPAAEITRDAWICFWTGQALLRVNEEQARTWFGYAYAAFSTHGDRQGKRLAAACIVTAFGLDCSDLRELNAWIDCHREAGGDTPIAPDDRFEASLMMGALCAAFVCAGFPPQIDADALIVRLASLIDVRAPWLSDDQRVQAACLLIHHSRAISGKLEQGRNVVVASRFLIDASLGSALHRGRWLIAAAQVHFGGGDTLGSAKLLSEARLVTTRARSPRLSFELGQALVEHSIRAQDFSRAADELEALEVLAMQAAPAERAEYARLKTNLLLLTGQAVEGLKWAEEARRLAVPAGYTGANLRGFDTELVYALAANDRLKEAFEFVKTLQFEPRGARAAIECCLRFLVEGETDISQLREGLKNAAALGFVNLLDRARGPLRTLYDRALAHDIETEFVLRVIELKKLSPPPMAGPHWPWQVKVRTLGGFFLDIAGERYRPSHKAQDKPLELLKLLLTCQVLGRTSAEKGWVAERLWPDAQGDNARKSLDMTVGRLRRLLQNEDTVIANEGRLELSQTLVWSDIGPLLRSLLNVRLQRDDRMAGKLTPIKEAAAIVRTVLDHYDGPYLANEEGPPWLLAGREAVAAAVRQVLLIADTILDGTADELLIGALEKAFAADPTSEDLARALMKAHLRQGNYSETLRVHRRLREMLSLLMGVAPSAESDHIRDQAYGERVTETQSARTPLG